MIGPVESQASVEPAPDTHHGSTVWRRDLDDIAWVGEKVPAEWHAIFGPISTTRRPAREPGIRARKGPLARVIAALVPFASAMSTAGAAARLRAHLRVRAVAG